MGPNQSSRVTSLSGITQVLRQGLAILLAVALTGAGTASAFAKESQAPETSMAAAQVKKFGVGKAVKVKLIGGEKVSGHIQSISADAFRIKLSKQGGERVIPYAQVGQVKDPSPVTWMLIGAAIVIVIIVAAKL